MIISKQTSHYIDYVIFLIPCLENHNFGAILGQISYKVDILEEINDFYLAISSENRPFQPQAKPPLRRCNGGSTKKGRISI